MFFAASCYAGEMGSGSGSSYPTTLDTDNTVEVSTDYATENIPNDTNAAVIKIENELGVLPKGGYASVAARLNGMSGSTTTFGVAISSAWSVLNKLTIDTTTAQVAISSAQTQINTKVSKAGDTMTGMLTQNSSSTIKATNLSVGVTNFVLDNGQVGFGTNTWSTDGLRIAKYRIVDKSGLSIINDTDGSSAFLSLSRLTDRQEFYFWASSYLDIFPENKNTKTYHGSGLTISSIALVGIGIPGDSDLEGTGRSMLRILNRNFISSADDYGVSLSSQNGNLLAYIRANGDIYSNGCGIFDGPVSVTVVKVSSGINLADGTFLSSCPFSTGGGAPGPAGVTISTYIAGGVLSEGDVYVASNTFTGAGNICIVENTTWTITGVRVYTLIPSTVTSTSFNIAWSTNNVSLEWNPNYIFTSSITVQENNVYSNWEIPDAKTVIDTLPTALALHILAVPSKGNVNAVYGIEIKYWRNTGQ